MKIEWGIVFSGIAIIISLISLIRQIISEKRNQENTEKTLALKLQEIKEQQKSPGQKKYESLKRVGLR